MIDTSTVLQIGSLQAFLGVAVVLIAMGVAWGTLKKSVSNIDSTLREEIKPDLKNIRERFTVVEDRVQTLWQEKFAAAHSPRKLTERGTQILDDSGVKKLVDDNREKLLEIVRNKNATNAYDAEQAILDVMMKECQQHININALKESAFKVGATPDVILFVGGIYLRDLIFKDLGFSLDDIDAKQSTIPNL